MTRYAAGTEVSPGRSRIENDPVTPCPHKLTVARSPIGSGWLIICIKCRTSWGPYICEAEAREKMEEKKP